MQINPAIITFSHLRWDFVYQRPQHLLSRMASSRRVIFIEEPVFDEISTPRWEFTEPEPNVLVARPYTRVREPGFHSNQLPALHELLRELIEKENLKEYVLWFYTPMAIPLADQLNPQAVIY